MTYELIITEKPAAADKIASALADGKPIKEGKAGVSYYKITRGKQDIVVACAVGHLFTLAEKVKGKWTYPVFDVEWKPTADVSKGGEFSRKYLNTIKSLAKEARSFTVATDYDIEGEVIGINVLRYACKKENGARMKYSTLTKPDLIESYENKSKTIDWGQANAGLTRHELDWYYGINLSRALTASIKSLGRFKIMSSGRVQGPALKILVDREKEILAFKPVAYWQIQLLGSVKKGPIEAWHIKDKFWEKKEAEEVMKKTKGKDAAVSDISKSEFEVAPPEPFDLTTLQTEAYRWLRISPKDTLAIAQELYLAGAISYPRTSSQQLPPAIGYKKILEGLAKQDKYQKLAAELSKKAALKPNNGKKSDSAHPAIYPTGLSPKHSARSEKVYDLIVKRFMATFGEPAKKLTVKVKIDCNSEIFVASGTTTVKPGWMVYYAPYTKPDEAELPAVEKGEHISIKSITMQDKETQPPNRYTPASIIRALEKKNLGTKATRAQIIDTLFQRGYVEGKTIQPTELGIHTVNTLEKYCPSIQDEELTRHFEEEMDEIRENKKQSEEVLSEAKEVLIKILKKFKEKEKDIGQGLIDAHAEQQTRQETMGKCPNCADGNLIRRRGKYGSFIACTNYPKCKTTLNFPNNVKFKSEGKLCEHCNHPIITVFRERRAPQQLCINPECKAKGNGEEAEKKKCPKCKGNLVLRKSIYGQFYGCSNYPKCKHIEKMGKQNDSSLL